MIENRVAVEEPTANAGTPEASTFGLMENRPQGVDDAMPTFPLEPIIVSAEVEVVAKVEAEEVAK